MARYRWATADAVTTCADLPTRTEGTEHEHMPQKRSLHEKRRQPDERKRAREEIRRSVEERAERHRSTEHGNRHDVREQRKPQHIPAEHNRARRAPLGDPQTERSG